MPRMPRSRGPAVGGATLFTQRQRGHSVQAGTDSTAQRVRAWIDGLGNGRRAGHAPAPGAETAPADATHARLIENRLAILRTRILREMRSRGWHRLAVVPLTRGAGGSFVARELARAIARQPHTRAMLIDLDLAQPSQAGMLGIAGCPSLAEALAAGQPLDEIATSLADSPNLIVIAPARAEPAAAEILQDDALARALALLQVAHPGSIAILDTAPLIGADDALAALPLAEAILLVADGRNGTAADMTLADRLLKDMPPVMGVVLNKSED